MSSPSSLSPAPDRKRSRSPLRDTLYDAVNGLSDRASEAATGLGDFIAYYSGQQEEEGEYEDEEGKFIRRTRSFRSPILRTRPVTVAQYMKYFDAEGKIENPGNLRHLVFSGGASEEIRNTLWEFLLGVYAWDSTYDDRSVMQHENQLEYERLLAEAKAIVQSKEQTTLQEEIIDQIDKDVTRNDRDHYFFAGDENVNLKKLENLLLVHCLVHKPKLGYVQGLNEFASMFIYISTVESDAFWLFAKLMNFMGGFFQPEDNTDMNRQFNTLVALVGEHDQEIFQILQKLEAADILFAYRWMLLNFKREVTFEESLLVSEVIWSMPIEKYTQNQLDLGNNPYVLFIALAIILLYRDDIIHLNDYSEIVIYMNGLSNRLIINEVLCKAECLFWNYVDGKIPPYRLQRRSPSVYESS